MSLSLKRVYSDPVNQRVKNWSTRASARTFQIASLGVSQRSTIARTSLRAMVDLWETPKEAIWKVRAEARVDQFFTRWFTGSLYTRFNDKDIQENGTGQCY